MAFYRIYFFQAERPSQSTIAKKKGKKYTCSLLNFPQAQFRCVNGMFVCLFVCLWTGSGDSSHSVVSRSWDASHWIPAASLPQSVDHAVDWTQSTWSYPGGHQLSSSTNIQVSWLQNGEYNYRLINFVLTLYINSLEKLSVLILCAPNDLQRPFSYHTKWQTCFVRFLVEKKQEHKLSVLDMASSNSQIDET